MLTPLPTPGDTKWFTHDRFGLFIHWGLYAMPARHEWVRHNELLTDADYEVYFRHFDPDLYDPRQWAEAAANAGMKYFVITTKHHEGFCLWDSKLTDYKSMNTPAKRDLLTPMLAAFRERGMRVGLYHSLIDWHHPHYVVDPHSGPYRTSPDIARLNVGRDQKKYAEYLYGQVRELLTEFGPIDILWCDFSYPKPDGTGKGKDDWQSEKLYEMIRELQPKVILNDRLDLPGGWDIKTPEQFQPQQWVHVDGKPVVWEACQTFSGSWGYHRDETSWKSLDQLLLMLVDTVSKGGNLLLNVGPTGRGEIDQRALERLAGLGRWMHHHSRSIYGCTQAPPEFKTPTDCRLTYNPDTKRVYVHILVWPFVELHLDGFAGKIDYAQLLNDASQIKIEGKPEWQTHFSGDQALGWTTLRLPVQKPDVALPVIEIFLK
jgi:alpha-L-fucosidase